MGLIQKMTDKVRTGLRNFIQYNEAKGNTIIINEYSDHLTSCVKNRIWYQGKSKQLSELYEQLNVPNTMFWKAKMTSGQEIRKIHIPLPSLEVDTITNIVMSDYNGIEISDKNTTESANRWKEIEKENLFPNILKEALTDLGIVGDGAFKISYDAEISKLPIIEWYPAERIKFTYIRGRIREIIFYTDYAENKKKYQFAEIYGYGYIKYELYDNNGNVIPLNSLKKTSWIKGTGITFDKSYMWVVPVIFGKSCIYKGRGKSLISTLLSTSLIVTAISSSESTKPFGLSISRITQVPYGTLAKEKLPSSADVVVAIAVSVVNSSVPVLKIPITAPPRALPSSSDFLPLTEP